MTEEKIEKKTGTIKGTLTDSRVSVHENWKCPMLELTFKVEDGFIPFPLWLDQVDRLDGQYEGMNGVEIAYETLRKMGFIGKDLMSLQQMAVEDIFKKLEFDIHVGWRKEKDGTISDQYREVKWVRFGWEKQDVNDLKTYDQVKQLDLLIRKGKTEQKRKEEAPKDGKFDRDDIPF